MLGSGADRQRLGGIDAPPRIHQVRGAGWRLGRSRDAVEWACRRLPACSESAPTCLEKRDTCRLETVSRYMNTEHIEVGPDYSDTQVAEIFLHHRVLIVPVVDEGRVCGSWPAGSNGAPALRIDPEGAFDSAVSLTVDGGRIARIYSIRNPHQLTGLDTVAVLAR